MFRRVRIWLGASALAAIFACNTPSVPLPPPDLPALGFVDQGLGAGLAELQGKPDQQHIDARFYVYNRSRGDGVIVTAGADGSFTTSPFAGTDGDNVELYYDTPMGERSATSCVALHFNAPLLSVPCN